MKGGKAVGVETARGFIGCDHLVLAAGPQIGRLAAGRASSCPCRPRARK